MPTNEQRTVSGKNFADEILSFASSIDGLLVTLPGVMTQIYDEHKRLTGEIGAGLKNDPRMFAKIKRRDSIERGFHLIHRSFLTSQISRYDAYLGSLMRLVYRMHPERAMSTEKQITGKELLGFESIEELRESFISKEVDALLFKSHEEQIKCLEKMFHFKAEEILPELPNFIECAQRRHLYVHCDGVASERYIKKCKAAGVALESDAEVGKVIEVSPEYLFKAFETVYLVGVKIGITIWTKNFKADQAGVANLANQLGLELISNNRHSLAINLFTFALSGKQKMPDDTIYRYSVLNLAQAYKWSGNQAKCIQQIRALDWSASADLLKLGVAILSDEFGNAIKLMYKVNMDEKFKKDYYALWPIFRELRKTPEFKKAYREIYSEDFIYEE